MSLSQTAFDGVSVVKKANVYFDGKCVSHTVTLPDGVRKSVGVVLPSQLTFNTGVAERMECVAGGCRYRINGPEGHDWQTSTAGESFAIPANSSFDIEVTGEAYHYVCHFE